MNKMLDFIGQYVSSLIGIAIGSVLLWVYQPSDSISAKLFMLFVIPLGLYTILTIPYLIKYWLDTDKNVKLPKLKIVQDGICMFDASDLFSSGCFVSIFYVDDYEKMIGYGKVDTIKSDNGILQVTVSEFGQGYDYQFMLKNRKNIVLKPTCPFEKIMMLMEKLSQGENNE